VTVLFFHTARVQAQREEWQVMLAEPLTEAQFWDLLVAHFPALGTLQGKVRLAKNQRYLEPGELIEAEDEVALIPPVSGG
jgi:MoaE-MoaD fusion protein